MHFRLFPNLWSKVKNLLECPFKLLVGVIAFAIIAALHFLNFELLRIILHHLMIKKIRVLPIDISKQLSYQLNMVLHWLLHKSNKITASGTPR